MTLRVNRSTFHLQGFKSDTLKSVQTRTGVLKFTYRYTVELFLRSSCLWHHQISTFLSWEKGDGVS